MEDTVGAFLPDGRFDLEGAGEGPLKGLTFAAKDIIDIAGRVTGCGNPDWAASHAAATSHAPVVEALLAAGANLAGKTITDELAYSLNGQNFHYGTPANTNAPGRIPGGSSCGSAAATAAGLSTWRSAAIPAARSAFPRAIAACSAFAPATAWSLSTASWRWPPRSTRSAGWRPLRPC